MLFYYLFHWLIQAVIITRIIDYIIVVSKINVFLKII